MSTTVQNEVGGAGTMTADQAFAEAMKFENRPNPYPFFDELRKTPVARLTNGTLRRHWVQGDHRADP